MFRSRELSTISPSLPAIALLTVSFLWLRLEEIPLFQVDAVAYSQVAKELSLRPIWEWCQLFWRGTAYYEHPPLMKWVLALSIRLFGATSIATVLPALLFSTATVMLVFLICTQLWTERYALLATLALLLSPSFVRNARNPMLEPPLTFFIYLAVYCALVTFRRRQPQYAGLCGISLACGLLTKGPPALVILPAFWWLLHTSRPQHRHAAQSILGLTLGALLPLALFESWHYVQTGSWFFKAYYCAQLLPAAIVPTPQTDDSLFYVKDCLQRQWPALALAILAPLALAQFKDVKAKRVFGLGIIMWWLPLIAFSFFHKKSSWYANITTPAIALVAAIPLELWLPRKIGPRPIAAFAFSLAVFMLLLGSTVPSLFRYPRPVEDFFHALSRAPQANALNGKLVADCVGLDPWKGPFFLSYYFDSRLTACQSPLAQLQLTTRDSKVHQASMVFQTPDLSLWAIDRR